MKPLSTAVLALSAAALAAPGQAEAEEKPAESTTKPAETKTSTPESFDEFLVRKDCENVRITTEWNVRSLIGRLEFSTGSMGFWPTHAGKEAERRCLASKGLKPKVPRKIPAKKEK